MPKRDDGYMQARRAEVLAAAKAIALEKGLARVTLRDIAAKAGISIGALTNHFSRREQIIRLAAAQSREARQMRLARVAEASDPPGALIRALSELLLAADFETAAALELELLVEGRSNAEVGEIVGTGVRDAADDLARLLRASGASAGAARERARLLLAAYFGFAALKLLDTAPSKTAVNRLLKSLVEGDF